MILTSLLLDFGVYKNKVQYNICLFFIIHRSENLNLMQSTLQFVYKFRKCNKVMYFSSGHDITTM